MSDILIHEQLWASSMLPEGIVEAWLVEDGETVAANQPLVTVRIEDSLHEICAPAAGRVAIAWAVNSVVEPGAVVGAVLT